MEVKITCYICFLIYFKKGPGFEDILKPFKFYFIPSSSEEEHLVLTRMS